MTPRNLLRALIALLAPLLARGVDAKLCGDNVNGRDVPCACGDTVVSDVVLTGDPVTHTICPGDGLIIRAGSAARGVTIDVGGRTIRGTGEGAGIWVLYGGSGGARLVSTGRHARIDGFRDGIVAHGTDTLARVDGIIVSRSRRDGMRIHGDGFVVHNTRAADSGRDGFSLSGRNFLVTATRARHSARFGYFVSGQGAAIGLVGAGNRSHGSGLAGFSLVGAGHHLVDCTASGAATQGFHLSGMHYIVRGCLAQGNGGDGLVGTGSSWHLAHNRALDNADEGLVIHGSQVVDDGGNSGSGNHGQRHPQRPPRQCEIAATPCVP